MNTRSVKEFLVALISGALGASCFPWLFTDVPEPLLSPSWSPLRRHSTWYLPEKMDPKTGYYSYGATLDPMLRNERGALITYQFSKPAVQQMVRNAELPGEVQPNGDVMLRGLQKEHIDKLIATVWLEPFGVVARLPRELDPCRGALTESARARAFVGE